MAISLLKNITSGVKALVSPKVSAPKQAPMKPPTQNYPSGFIGPLQPGSVRYPSNFIGPIQPGSTRAAPAQQSTSTFIPSGPAGGGGGGPAPVQGPQQPSGFDDQLNNGNDQIDRDFELFMGQLGGQEEGLRRDAGQAQQEIGSAFDPARTALQQEEQKKMGILGEQEQKTQGQEKSSLQQARDLYRQIQQQNIAQLSGMGLSSSSVAEALAENLGVETARRIASVSQNANDIYQNIQKERKNVTEYVTQRVSELEQEKANRLSSIQNELLRGLDQINQARNAAAVDKANRRADLLQQAQSAAAQLQLQAQQFQQSLQAWNAQNQQRLASAASTDYNALFQNQLQQIPGITSMIPQGYETNFSIPFGKGGKINISPQKQKEEEIPNPFL